MTTTQNKLTKAELLVTQLKAKLEVEKNKVTTKIVKLSMGTYEIETKIHHFNKTYAECEKDCPKGWQIATYPILQELRNTKPEEFNLLETWEFVQNPDKIRKEKGEVARFLAGSGGASLYCNRVPSNSVDGLGVRFVRKVSK
jgi:radical SAM superfamily enzyme YgiQ (UPF0313 family)